MRADIQGLRALAVALVVVFHLSPQTLAGGYIGVDVFFVISGFLITGHLLREVRETGTVRVGRFWARRARRLLPAAFTVLGMSWVVVWWVLPVTDRYQNLTEIGFASGYILNWRLAAMSVDYLGAENQPSIVQHFWSLSVEEQFYLVWPLLILLAIAVAARLTSRATARVSVIAVTLALVFVASLVHSAVATAASQPQAYFATTTRAWEFAAGGLLCFVPTVRMPDAVRAGLSWAAVAAIVFAAVTYSGGTQFPGVAALLPVAGTAVVIQLGGDLVGSWSPQRLLVPGPVRFLGDVSYALYLWHWPVIVVAAALIGDVRNPLAVVVVIVVTIGLSAATKRLVEDPVRRAPGILRRTAPTFALMTAGVVALVALTIVPLQAARADAAAYESQVALDIADLDGCFGAYALLNHCDDPYRADDLDPVATQVGYLERTPNPRFCTAETIADRQEVRCRVDRDGEAPRAIFIGDSHAEHLLEPMLMVAEREGWDLTVRTRGGCSGLENPAAVGRAEHSQRCAAWGAEVRRAALTDKSIDMVVFSLRPATKKASTRFAAERLTALAASGLQVAVIRDVPGTEFADLKHGAQAKTGPQCAAEAPARSDPCAYPDRAGSDWALDAALQAGVDVVDTHDILCPLGICHVIIGDTIVYGDSNHLAVPFAKTLAPRLAQELRPLIER